MFHLIIGILQSTVLFQDQHEVQWSLVPELHLLSSLGGNEDINLSPGPGQLSILHNFTKMIPSWPAIPPANSLIASRGTSSGSGTLLKFPFLISWGQTRQPKAPLWWAGPLKF